jgi:hypothetical protein
LAVVIFFIQNLLGLYSSWSEWFHRECSKRTVKTTFLLLKGLIEESGNLVASDLAG